MPSDPSANIHIPLYTWEATTVQKLLLPTYLHSGEKTEDTTAYIIPDNSIDAVLVLTACGKVVPYEHTLLNRDLGLSETTCEKC